MFIILIFFIFIFSFLATYFIKEYAIKKSLLASVNERSSHTVPTPHGGGIAIAVSWFIGITYLYVDNSLDKELFFALLSGAVLSFVSFLDDIYELSAKLRLFVQSIVTILALYFLGGLHSVDLIFINITDPYIANILAYFMIMWSINLYNFLDGIDGYAASEGIFLSIGGYLLFNNEIFLILMASLAGFLVWNWHRAKIFMGDVGSTLIGFNVGVFAIYYSNILSENLLVWIVLYAVFWFDATYTLFKRFKNKEKLSQAHKKHLYQRLTQAGFSHANVTIFATILNSLIFTSYYFFFSISFSLLFSLVVFFITIKYIDNKVKF